MATPNLIPDTKAFHQYMKKSKQITGPTALRPVLFCPECGGFLVESNTATRLGKGSPVEYHTFGKCRDCSRMYIPRFEFYQVILRAEVILLDYQTAEAPQPLEATETKAFAVSQDTPKGRVLAKYPDAISIRGVGFGSRVIMAGGRFISREMPHGSFEDTAEKAAWADAALSIELGTDEPPTATDPSPMARVLAKHPSAYVDEGTSGSIMIVTAPGGLALSDKYYQEACFTKSAEEHAWANAAHRITLAEKAILDGPEGH